MNIIRKRGDTYPDEISVALNGSTADLTGCSLKLTLNREKYPVNTDNQVYQIDGIIDAPLTGVVKFAPTLLQSDQVGSFYYDIQLTDQLGIIRTIKSGIYEYKQDITK